MNYYTIQQNRLHALIISASVSWVLTDIRHWTWIRLHYSMYLLIRPPEELFLLIMQIKLKEQEQTGFNEIKHFYKTGIRSRIHLTFEHRIDTVINYSIPRVIRPSKTMKNNVSRRILLMLESLIKLIMIKVYN